MSALKIDVLFIYSIALATVVLATPLNDNTCQVTSFSKVKAALKHCKNIVIKDVTVPPATTLDLNLKDGSTVTFEGTIKFSHAVWKGPLMKVRGNAITVQGSSGHILNGQGENYWDGKGDKGTLKPKFFRIQATGGSVFKDLNLLNCPKQCVSIGHSNEVNLTGWNIDVSSGDEKGKNTDGFDVVESENIRIEDCVVQNQDDCVAVNSGKNLTFTGLTCSGGHGLSISVGQSKSNSSCNILDNVIFSKSIVKKSRNGIHVKTHTDGAEGYVKGVTYNDIILEDITHCGISVQQDYQGGGSTGTPSDNIPITGLTLSSVTGSMKGSHAKAVEIICAKGACTEWEWSGISVTGAAHKNSCNFKPPGFTC